MSSICERIDEVTRIPERYRGTIIPAPISVKVELTARCNFKCSFCHTSMNLRKKGHMEFETFQRLAEEMVDAGVKELGVFFLGESFLYPKLPEAIKYAKDIGFEYVFLTTNGSISTPDRVRDCMKAGLDSLKFSFNYADEEQFADIAQVKPKFFEKMIDNIQMAYSVREMGGYDCGLYASYIDYDGEQGKKMLTALKRIEGFVDEAYALPLYSQADIVTKDELARGWTPTAGNRGRLAALREGLPCWSCFSEGHITYDAKLSACCFEGRESFQMADLNEVDFITGWNSEKFQELRKHHLARDVTDTPCSDCVAYL